MKFVQSYKKLLHHLFNKFFVITFTVVSEIQLSGRLYSYFISKIFQIKGGDLYEKI